MYIKKCNLKIFFHYENALLVASVQHVMLRQKEGQVPRQGDMAIREQAVSEEFT